MTSNSGSTITTHQLSTIMIYPTLTQGISNMIEHAHLPTCICTLTLVDTVGRHLSKHIWISEARSLW